MNLKRFSCLSMMFCASWVLSGCTMWHSGDGLPDRDSIRAGEEIVVEKNENVYAIARKNGVSMREIIVLNDLKAPYMLKSGQKLTLPLKEGAEPNVPYASPRSSIETTTLEPINSSVTSAPLPPVPPVSTTVATIPEPAVTETTVAGLDAAQDEPAPIAAASNTDTGDFKVIPPVQGPIISAFGSKGQGMSNDGINIGAPKGSSVVAAAGGIVVYSGNEMKGFGNLILIRHEGGWVTAYAHLDRMLVSRDAVVAPGDMIGTVGTTGGVSAPQLHFETRLNGKPVDPQTLIKKSG